MTSTGGSDPEKEHAGSPRRRPSVEGGRPDGSGGNRPDLSAPPRWYERRWIRWSVWLLWVVGVTLVVAPLVPSGQHRVGPGVVSIGVAPGLDGSTSISLPPLGRVSADTHPAPVHVTAELRELDLQPVIAAGGRLDAETIEAEVRHDLPGAVATTLIRLLVTGAIIGGIAAAVLPRRRWPTIILGALVGVASVGVLAGSVLIDFDASRFDEPTYDGSLSLGGPFLAAVTSGSGSPVDARIDVLAAKLSTLYSASTTTRILESEGSVAILHVSDIHLNPIGVNLTRELARNFEVDAIVDTGDTTSFGLPIEEPFSDLFDEFGVPYYFVAGNHDSPANRRAISAAPGVTSIDRRVVDVEGVRVLGFDDPVVTTTRTVPKPERKRIMDAAEPELTELTELEQPDVVAIHNPAMAPAVTGRVPVVMAGHLHRTVTTTEDGTVVAVVGSTGATGLGSLNVATDEPYLAQVLRFNDDAELVAIDNIELIGTSGDFVVRRTLMTGSDTVEAIDGDSDSVLREDPDEPTLDELDPSADLDATTSTVAPDSSSSSTTTARSPGRSTVTTGPGD